MFTPTNAYIKHKIELLDLLREILSDNYLAKELMFKGGTYAALRGALDRFSVDLDFDLPKKGEKAEVKRHLNTIFKNLELEIKNESKNYIQYFLKYEPEGVTRNTLKLEINDDPSALNEYEKVNLSEINMYCNGHTLDTMFANKLVAVTARYKKNKKVSSRDFYDIFYFYKSDFPINKNIIRERTGFDYKDYLKKLIKFVEKEADTANIKRDLSQFFVNTKNVARLEHLKEDLLLVLRTELAELKN